MLGSFTVVRSPAAELLLEMRLELGVGWVPDGGTGLLSPALISVERSLGEGAGDMGCVKIVMGFSFRSSCPRGFEFRL